MGFLGGKNAGDARHGEHIALGVAVGLNQLQGLRPHADPRLGQGLTLGERLVTDIDHVRMALAVEVGEAGRWRIAGFVHGQFLGSQKRWVQRYLVRRRWVQNNASA
ncbi:hypothetical protein D3C81_1513160 [compost metagenome]